MRFHGGSLNGLPEASSLKGELDFTLSEDLPASSYEPFSWQESGHGWRYRVREGMQELVHTLPGPTARKLLFYTGSPQPSLPRVTAPNSSQP